jgi:hypothetical protein
MISANELSGVLAMMPAFATPDAIDTEQLKQSQWTI